MASRFHRCFTARLAYGYKHSPFGYGSAWEYPRVSIISTDWGVLVAERQQVKRVGKSLTEISYQHFLPLYEHLSIVGGRHVREMKPLLGSYILIAICASWRELMSWRGVAGILMNESGHPARVNIREVERLREFCPNDVFRNDVNGIVGLTYGQRVTSKEGPFAYHIGRYDGKKGRNREVAVFTLFGREQKITFRSGDLIAA